MLTADFCCWKSQVIVMKLSLKAIDEQAAVLDFATVIKLWVPYSF